MKSLLCKKFKLTLKLQCIIMQWKKCRSIWNTRCLHRNRTWLLINLLEWNLFQWTMAKQIFCLAWPWHLSPDTVVYRVEEIYLIIWLFPFSLIRKRYTDLLRYSYTVETEYSYREGFQWCSYNFLSNLPESKVWQMDQ